VSNLARALNSTISKYLRKEEVNVLRRRKLTTALKARGRIVYNDSGTDLVWRVRYKRAPLVPYGIGQTNTFSQRNKRKTATLPWRSYIVTDSMTKGERLQNRGQEAIVKIYANIVKELVEDIADHFAEELYVDGNAAGNEQKIHGLESFFGTSGPASTGYIGTPSDTYAGHSTALGSAGGSWTGNWPDGYGDAQYDWWSPLIVDYTDASWTASTDTWANNAEEAMRFGIINCARNDSQVDMVLLEKNLYRQFLDALSDRQRFNIDRRDTEDPNYSLGFSDYVMFDGVRVTWEHGLPSGVGYGISLDAMDLRSLQSQLFDNNNEDFDIASMSHRFAVDFYGNLRCNPRAFFKLVSLT